MNRGVDRKFALIYIKTTLAGWFLATGAWALVRWAWPYISGHSWR